ncbi:hypothetical protein L7F22_022080 [Adiantum nelumboides]|nr:hypothetical protein [Adiantum nelumboides]
MISYRTPVFSQDLDVGTLNSQSRSFASAVLKDVTNKTFPCLSLPEETTDTLYQGVEELLLQLSLSQTQMTTDKNSKSEAYSRLDSERPKNMVETVFKVNSAGQYQLSTKMDAAIDNKEIIIANELVSPAASQSTGSTDLFLPSAKHLKSTRGDNRFSVDKSYQGKRSSNKSPLLSGGKKNSKSKNITVSDKDVQAAIGLTVATAETLVIADIMNGCRMCQYLGPKGILDAALVLRRERDASGLNDFMLQDQQGTSLADSRWEEDLDDTVLEAECFGTLPTVSLEKATCRNTSRLANMQSHVRLKTEKAVEAAKELGRTTRSTAARHSDAQYKESSTSIGEVMQGRMTHPLPAIDNKQAVAPQESFNSRWLGGWTGVKCAEGQQACLKEGQLEKKRNNSLKYETSELSETCGLPPPAENLSSCFRDVQMKSAKCSVDAMPEGDAEALSTGSCAEILLALSQASIKYSCSLQEPLCSFVPCSVNLTVKPPIAQPPRCNDAESAENMTKNGTANGLVSGDKDKMGIQSNLLESSPARGTKRTCLDSLRKHSTISSNLEGTLQPSESYCPKLIQEERSLLIGNDADVAVNTARSLVPPNKSVQCQLILEDSTLQDSPPLIWHRSKRRRLRACRIAESDLIQGISSDSLSGYPPVAGEPANCLEPENINSQNREHVRQTRKDEVHILEPENMKSEECEHIRETRKDVQLLSHGNQLSTRNHGEPRLPQDQPYKVSGIGQCHLEVLEVVNTKQKAYKRRERNGSTCQIFNGVRFLVTGFSAGQKNIIEDLSKKIQDHGGVIMSSIPSLSNLNGRRTLPRQCTTTLHSVVIAPQKVRTLKYLYGCAAGLLIVKPIWLDEMIAKKGLRFNHK